MNPDTPSTDITLLSPESIGGINLDPTHLVWTTVVTLVISHIGAQYLAGVTPRGYWFWFTILNLIVGFMFM